MSAQLVPRDQISQPRRLSQVIHQTWKHRHLRWPLSACVDSFKKWNPSWQHVLWTDEACEALIRERLPAFLPTYLAYAPGILRADIFRVAVLYIEGGVYADLDMECLRPLDDLIAACGQDDTWEVLLARDHPCHERTHYCGRAMWLNAFMIAKPRSSFFGHVLDALTRQVAGWHDSKDPVQATGPGLLTRMVELGSNDLVSLGIREMPWQWVHPLPHVFVSFPERSQYKQLIRTREWREGRQVRLKESGENFQRWGEPPFAAHYWWHSYIQNHREVNMLSKYASSLLQTDGEIVERRLNALPEALMALLPQTLCEALCEMAERGGCRIGLLGEFSPALIEVIAGAGSGLGWQFVHDMRTDAVDLLLATALTLHEVPLLETLLTVRGILAVLPDNDSQPGVQAVRSGGLRLWRAGALIWERSPDASHEIPPLLHLFSFGDDTDLPKNVVRRLRSLHVHWNLQLWTAATLKAWVLEHYPQFAPIFFDYPTDAHRVLAGRFLVLARLGGVALMPGVIPLRSCTEAFCWKKLVLGVRRSGDSLESSDWLMASCAGHPFWRGLCSALEHCRHAALEEAAGQGFLAKRAHACIGFLDRTDWPELAEPGTLPHVPAGDEWQLLVKHGMWEALAVMYPNVTALALNDIVNARGKGQWPA